MPRVGIKGYRWSGGEPQGGKKSKLGLKGYRWSRGQPQGGRSHVKGRPQMGIGIGGQGVSPKGAGDQGYVGLKWVSMIRVEVLCAPFLIPILKLSSHTGCELQRTRLFFLYWFCGPVKYRLYNTGRCLIVRNITIC